MPRGLTGTQGAPSHGHPLRKHRTMTMKGRDKVGLPRHRVFTKGGGTRGPTVMTSVLNGEGAQSLCSLLFLLRDVCRGQGPVSPDISFPGDSWEGHSPDWAPPQAQRQVPILHLILRGSRRWLPPCHCHPSPRRLGSYDTDVTVESELWFRGV